MTGELMKAYRKERKITQTQLAEELSTHLGMKYDKALVSKVESGMVELTENAKSYLASKINFKAVATDADARKDEGWTIMPPAQKKSLKSPLSKNWNERGLTQNECVLAYIDEFGSITSKEAFDLIGVTRLASRICDLEKWGYHFIRRTESADNRYGDKVRFTRYSLEEDDGKKNMD